MPRYDMKHPDARRIRVFNEKGDRLRGVIAVDTEEGWAMVYEVEEKRHADIFDEVGLLKHKGEPYFMIKKNDKNEPIINKLLGKFTVKIMTDEELAKEQKEQENAK